jgi:hypothetical protein
LRFGVALGITPEKSDETPFKNPFKSSIPSDENRQMAATADFLKIMKFTVLNCQ